MTPIERAGYLAHAMSPVFKRRMDVAFSCIMEGLGLCDRPYVGYSAGKDSSAMLWLVLEQKPDIHICFMTRPESRMLHADLDSVIAGWKSKFPNADFREVDGGEYGSAHGNIRSVVRESGHYDGAFIGLRAQESNGRARSLGMHRHGSFSIHRYAESNKHGNAGTYRICPLANWSVNDVGALIALHSLPVLAAYDENGDGLQGRTSLSLNKTALRLGEVAKLRARDPAGYARLIAERPELARET